MPSRKDPAAELVGKMLSVLEAQRALGAGEYPLTLERLGALADAQAAPALVLKAVAKKAFTERAVAAAKKDLAAPVALRDDLDQLAASPLVLEFVLDASCTPAKPAWALAQLARRLPAELRQPFAAAGARSIEQGTLPATVGVLPGKTAALLYLERLPPPPPPKKPDVALAEDLLRVLEGQRRLGAGSYPTTLRRLAELTDPQAPAKLLDKAVANPLFAEQAVAAAKKNSAAPVALRDDLDRLAAGPLVLEFALQLTRTAASQAQTPADLKKKLVPALQQPFADALNHHLRARALPPTVGCVRHKGRPLLFLLADLEQGTPAFPAATIASAKEELTSRGAPSPQPLSPQGRGASATDSDFAQAFAEAFDRLQQQRGADNYVSLLDLRRILSMVDRATFDAELRRLRLAGAYSLRLADGRFGISPEERAAGIPTEDGALWLFVSRNAP